MREESGARKRMRSAGRVSDDAKAFDTEVIAQLADIPGQSQSRLFGWYEL